MKRKQYLLLVILTVVSGLVGMSNSANITQETDGEEGEHTISAADETMKNGLREWQTIGAIAQIAAAIFALCLVAANVFLWLSTRRYAKATENLVGVTSDYSQYTKQMADTMSVQRDMSKKQLEIIEKQTELMSDQVALSQKIDESARFTVMLQEYAALSSQVNTFMTILKRSYEDNKKHLKITPKPATLLELVYETGPPDPVPLDQDNLQRYVEGNKGEWEDLLVWEFVNLIWKGSFRENSQLSQAHNDLMRFWSKWCMFLDVSKFLHYLEPEPGELIMLVWVELVNIREVPISVWPERIRPLLKLAKAYWSWWKETKEIFDKYKSMNNS